MSQSFSLTDSLSLGDLQVYLARAARVQGGSVRVIASGSVLAVYTGILYPRGLLDTSSTVLGLRTYALTTPGDFDLVVPVRGLLERIARLQTENPASETPVVVPLPIEAGTATWAGISPPTSGWAAMGEVDAAVLRSAASTGIDEVAAALPTGIGEQIVERVRAEIWGRPVDGVDTVPAGAAFAAVSLGFLGDEPVRLLEAGPWIRLTTSRGHVLVRRKR
ncbi:hypothetical protein [Cryobacterium psychrophilum]|uniref:Uncharacterized protein n=1 Tax=Cryobacterium psychrophilum TaxID=41988 RepID=A0A4Y8KSW7_9MICO|nr:hypothetical protein [Cryobacterium psychrophilum]TDW31307.1 hypothetical protein EDD25_3113 [Cryobacterium psychrophilum]TFD78410.1 hypothetical protein E3T53_09420 [Cryobacterium psychrophilum]